MKAEPFTKKLYQYLIVAISVAMAGTVVVVNAAYLFSPSMLGSAGGSFQTVMSGGLLGIMLILLSGRTYVLTDQNAGLKPYITDMSYGAAVLGLLSGIFSLLVAGFIAYVKMRGT